MSGMTGPRRRDSGRSWPRSGSASRVVAGSSRGGSAQVAGRFAVAGDRVVLTDWRRLTLRRAGDTLYGIAVDPGSGRTIQVRLDRTVRP